ncbi:MAG: hypothetical protein ACYCW6_28300 [Candidatus Xenobia bacterium]
MSDKMSVGATPSITAAAPRPAATVAPQEAPPPLPQDLAEVSTAPPPVTTAPDPAPASEQATETAPPAPAPAPPPPPKTLFEEPPAPTPPEAPPAPSEAPPAAAPPASLPPLPPVFGEAPKQTALPNGNLQIEYADHTLTLNPFNGVEQEYGKDGMLKLTVPTSVERADDGTVKKMTAGVEIMLTPKGEIKAQDIKTNAPVKVDFSVDPASGVGVFSFVDNDGHQVRATSKSLSMTVDGKAVGEAPTAPDAPGPQPVSAESTSPLKTYQQNGNQITENSETGVVRVDDPNHVMTLLVPTFRQVTVQHNGQNVQVVSGLLIQQTPEGKMAAADAVTHQPVAFEKTPSGFKFSDSGHAFEVDAKTLGLSVDGKPVKLQPPQPAPPAQGSSGAPNPEDPVELRNVEQGVAVTSRATLPNGNVRHELADGRTLTFNPRTAILRADHPDLTTELMVPCGTDSIPGENGGPPQQVPGGVVITRNAGGKTDAVEIMLDRPIDVTCGAGPDGETFSFKTPSGDSYLVDANNLSFIQAPAGADPSQAGQQPAPGPSGPQSGPQPDPQGSQFGPPPGAQGSQFGPPPGPQGSQFGPPPGAQGSQFGPPPGPQGSQFGPPPGAQGSQFGPPPGPQGSQFGPQPGPQGPPQFSPGAGIPPFPGQGGPQQQTPPGPGNQQQGFGQQAPQGQGPQQPWGQQPQQPWGPQPQQPWGPQPPQGWGQQPQQPWGPPAGPQWGPQQGYSPYGPQPGYNPYGPAYGAYGPQQGYTQGMAPPAWAQQAANFNFGFYPPQGAGNYPSNSWGWGGFGGISPNTMNMFAMNTAAMMQMCFFPRMYMPWMW